MSDLLLRIQNDLVDAMKKRDDLRLSVLRMLKSAAQMAQIEKGKDIPLTDDEVIVLVRRLIKQRNEAAEMYKSGGAQDRAQKELDEIKVLDSYLPEQMPEEEKMKRADFLIYNDHSQPLIQQVLTIHQQLISIAK